MKDIEKVAVSALRARGAEALERVTAQGLGLLTKNGKPLFLLVPEAKIEEVLDILYNNGLSICINCTPLSLKEEKKKNKKKNKNARGELHDSRDPRLVMPDLGEMGVEKPRLKFRLPEGIPEVLWNAGLDWEKFAERVQSRVKLKSNWDYELRQLEAIATEHSPEIAMETLEVAIARNWLGIRKSYAQLPGSRARPRRAAPLAAQEKTSWDFE